MTQREARVRALMCAYAAVNKSLGVGDDEIDEQDQIKVDNYLDAIAQSLYQRWKRAEERLRK